MQTPYFPELLQIVLEDFNGVFLTAHVFPKLLNDHQDKEVEHNEGANQNEGDEVGNGIGVPALLTIRAIIHHLVPILSGWGAEQQHEGIPKIAEIVPIINNLAFAHVLKHKDSQHRINKEH